MVSNVISVPRAGELHQCKRLHNQNYAIVSAAHLQPRLKFEPIPGMPPLPGTVERAHLHQILQISGCGGA